MRFFFANPLCSEISTSLFSVMPSPLSLNAFSYNNSTALCVKSEGGTCVRGWSNARVQVCRGGGSGTGRLAEEIKHVDSLVCDRT